MKGYGILIRNILLSLDEKTYLHTPSREPYVFYNTMFDLMISHDLYEHYEENKLFWNEVEAGASQYCISALYGIYTGFRSKEKDNDIFSKVFSYKMCNILNNDMASLGNRLNVYFESFALVSYDTALKFYQEKMKKHQYSDLCRLYILEYDNNRFKVQSLLYPSDRIDKYVPSWDKNLYNAVLKKKDKDIFEKVYILAYQNFNSCIDRNKSLIISIQEIEDHDWINSK